MAEQDALPEYSAKWWSKEIKAAEAEMDKKWRLSGDNVVARYLDEREQTGTSTDNANAKRYNIFWANTEIVKAALYATPPKPEVKRSHGDAKDDVARTAALILERLLCVEFEQDESDMHEAILHAVDDRLIPGLGQVWMRYDVHTESYTVPAVKDPLTGEEIAPAATAEKIVDEEVVCEYVHWRDFIYPAIRVWEELPWAGRRCYMRKKAFVKRFGEEKWAKVKEMMKEAEDTSKKVPKGFLKGQVEVFEVMCLDTNKVYWITHDLDEVLDEREDPLKLDKFFQFPKPLLATHTTNSFSPRSDFTMVQDQYQELDTLNERISTLTKALRVVGVYDKTNTELKQLLSGSEMLMIPVDNWAAFAEQGGLKGQVDWFPVDVIAGVLEKLTQQRIAVVGQIFELTSISDIMRGASNPRDTYGAQKLKAQYSSVRLQLRQQEVSRFVGQVLRIKCEIIAKHWQPETIKRKSMIEMTESAPYADAAIALIKDSESSEYRIEIGEETLSLADYNAERQLRTEYLTAVGQFVSQAGELMTQMPSVAPYLLRMIAWVTSAFRGSSDIETVLDEAIQTVTNQPPPGQENPNAEAENAERAENARAQADIASTNAKTQSAQAINQSKTQASAAQALVKVMAAHAMPEKEPNNESKGS